MQYKTQLEIGPSMDGPIGPDWDTLNLTPRGFQPTILADILKIPMPIPDNTYELVYASHVLEHVSYGSALAILIDWRRILKPGGVLELWVPDFAQIVKARYSLKTISMAEMNELIFSHGNVSASRHHSTYDYCGLHELFEAAYFVGISGLGIAPRGKPHAYNLGISGKK